MLKLAFVAVAATTLAGATVAQAKGRSQIAAPERYDTLARYDGDVASSRSDRSDMKVMGLSVPNGFREPVPVESRAY